MGREAICSLCVLGALAVMVLGSLTEEFLLKRFHLKDLPQVLLTMGLAFVIADTSLVIWGGEPMVMASPQWLRGAARIGPIYYPKYRLFVNSRQRRCGNYPMGFPGEESARCFRARVCGR